jgi:hypothetical protein
MDKSVPVPSNHLPEKSISLPISGRKAVISGRPFTGRDRINAFRLARVSQDESVYVFSALVHHARLCTLLSLDGRQAVPEDLDDMDERDIAAIEALLVDDPRFPSQEKKAVPPTLPGLSSS